MISGIVTGLSQTGPVAFAPVASPAILLGIQLAHAQRRLGEGQTAPRRLHQRFAQRAHRAGRRVQQADARQKVAHRIAPKSFSPEFHSLPQLPVP